MSYNYLTAGAFNDLLASRLGDPGKAFWLDDELSAYRDEALQTWNSASMYHRARGTFNTTPGTAFYDIGNLLSDGTSLILKRSLTLQELTRRVMYHLTENAGGVVDGSSWVGTTMFDLNSVQQAILRRGNRFLQETGQVLTFTQSVITSGSGRISLSQDYIDILRAGWTTPENKHSVIWRTSELVLDAQYPQWFLNPGIPQMYSIAIEPLVWLQLAPPPNDTGTLDLVTVNTATALNVFNDFGWVIKFGAIADLLGQEGEARDLERSTYAEQRYREGIQLAKIMSTILRTQINGVPAQPSSLFDLDANVPNWQDVKGTSGDDLSTPTTPAIAGPNMVALSPVPDVTLSVPQGNHSITMDVVRNAITPTLSTDFIQIGREFLDTILDYSFHLASFKMAGMEFENTNAHYERMMRAAMGYNARLAAQADDFDILSRPARKQEEQRPRIIPMPEPQQAGAR